ncbi:MAG TPA: exodeoxyribonuclease VII large subunit [Clostridiaceae bacterium]|nr:exodeoxyribonuclease VII large subunit [Clostridiaceae bacterium]
MQYILSVTEINKYIREIISKDLILSNLWVKGEISNFKHHYTGHMYFTLKDEKSLLKCVMFRNAASGLGFMPENGMKVIIRGYVSVFERDGQYQLYAEEMQPDGIGNLYIAFEQLKKKLAAEGLFDARYKKNLPFLPRSIGVVTSLTGAVIRDIINVLSRRFYNVQLKIFPVQVQGTVAAQQISAAIKKLNELQCVDVIILARGGGSLEDLWPFNEEVVARSIFESRIPIISAVGHETDYTISDLVADLRAPTPSAAAELVMPEKAALRTRIYDIDARLKNSLLKLIRLKRSELEKLTGSTALRQPYNIVYQGRMRLDMLDKDMTRAIKAKIERMRSQLAMLIYKLDALSPLSIMTRGYSIARKKNSGPVLKSAGQVVKGEEIEIILNSGRLNCTVNEIIEEEIIEEERK